MVQTSISAWLNKPKTQTLHEPQPRAKTASSTSQDAASTPPPAVTDSNIATDELPSQPIEPSTHEKDIGDNGLPSQSKSFRLKALPLPPNASLSAITSEHLDAYMRMTALLLPIPYHKKFFEEIVEDPDTAGICLIALWAQPSGNSQQNPPQKVVSGIRCRLLARSPALPQTKNQADDPTEVPTLYIAALTTLAPYRRYGLASALFQRVLSRAIREYGITTVTVHRWEANEEAQGWYESHGFKEVGFIDNYYRRLKPSGAFVLERKIGPQDLLFEDYENESKIS
ncbi:hypothetical protein BLS_003573 [Venturia inaequalis]|uniref:N-acetyltransferase domain-containing protein n=1 Tax=Venturia inaequalis TaxID=5025 RepID=A0A8H3YYG3_VENIN|nr:hypothetical protein BLS_003573 [Venturia inaequalis]KAE9979285.1 hypothetical protein EG328_001008 [Venturia inaequalis]KAE9993036.1 hypothetical protein EG327_006818 [Venturia inaequalis]RDI82564.1 hypothetical protein Vi05172_g7517 [Venturia inaequalis]